MTKTEIIAEVARCKAVERMVENVRKCGQQRDTLEDAIQEVYVVLLEMDDKIILEAWNDGTLKYLVARVVINTFKWTNTKYNKDFTEWNARRATLTNKIITIYDEEVNSGRIPRL